jgi:hypothetical protein
VADIYFRDTYSAGLKGRQLLDELRERFGPDRVVTRLGRRGPRDSMMSDAIASGVKVIVYVIGPGTKKNELEAVLCPEHARRPTLDELLHRDPGGHELDTRFVTDPDRWNELEIPVVAVLVDGVTANVLPHYERITPITLGVTGSVAVVAAIEQHGVVAAIEKHPGARQRVKAPNDPWAGLEPYEPKPPEPVSPSAEHEVFVSYAFEDQAFADAVVQALEKRDIRCWIASRDVPKGMEYAKRIPAAIRSSRLVVVVISKDASLSEDVLGEVTLAKEKNVPRLPFVIDDSPLDDGLAYFFSQRVRLHAAGMTREAALAALVEEVKRHLR